MKPIKEISAELQIELQRLEATKYHGDHKLIEILYGMCRHMINQGEDIDALNREHKELKGKLEVIIHGPK